ncbi:hypothetical protein [Phenylobacterium sp.]|jgi:hypothetical protein|uniref:hypothetical protein n=1 Tax=Phenylobacterium sp. TaxID=1871053 RepID=UPI002E3596E7|nr:hypothetical protein [Phenylobacterium sp.]HEX3363505.1 hypothetical protein [Phenylobacterium sp.]
MIHRNLAISLGFAGAYIGGAFALKAAERAGFIPHGAGGQALQVFNGLTLAVYGNFLPKRLGNFRNPASAMRMEQVLRVSGWAFMLGGLGFAVTSLLPVPFTVPIAVLSAATAYVLGYSAWAFMEHGPRKGEPRLDA